MRKIIVAGSILVDKINGIDAYPKAGELTQIRSLARAAGGLVPNTGSDIRLLAPDIPVFAFGAVGDDDEGRSAREMLTKVGLDVSGVKTDSSAVTSFTDVMSVIGGERTFFTYPGASANWGFEDFPFDKVAKEDIVLLGYFLLLDKIDRGDGLKILKKLKELGAETAIDLVTENSDRYALVRECLPFVDYLIVNEIEASRICGKDLPDEALCEELLNLGVLKRVIIHRSEKGTTLVRGGTPVVRPSFKLPPGFIKGKTGAGDAYCAGSLVGIYRGLPDEKILELGTLGAIGALSAPGATEGVKSEAEMRKLVAELKLTA